MYEYNRKQENSSLVASRRNIPRGGLGLPPILGPKNIPGLGWTGGFTISGIEQRFSVQTCSGSEANPMDQSSDLICGRSAEVGYLNRIGCVPVGFQGSHHCLTDSGNQGIFYCCPPGVLDAELARAQGQQVEVRAAAVSPGLGLALGGLALAVVGYGVWQHFKGRELLAELEGRR